MIRAADYDVAADKEALLLKECYDLAAQYGKLQIAQEILREKSGRIQIPEGCVPAQTGAADGKTQMQIISEVIKGLSLEGYAASEYTDPGYDQKMYALPDSAEKEFVRALLSLRDGTGETQRWGALQHISAALSDSPHDPRYIALARVLLDIN